MNDVNAFWKWWWLRWHCNRQNPDIWLGLAEESLFTWVWELFPKIIKWDARKSVGMFVSVFFLGRMMACNGMILAAELDQDPDPTQPHGTSTELLLAMLTKRWERHVVCCQSEHVLQEDCLGLLFSHHSGSSSSLLHFCTRILIICIHTISRTYTWHPFYYSFLEH